MSNSFKGSTMEVEESDQRARRRDGCGAQTKNFLSNHWKGIVVFVVPLMFLPVMFVENTQAYRCMYLLLVMAVFWVTEALPLYVTSMIPIVAFPVMGIMDTDRTCRLYFKDTLVMFMGGIMIALAIEYSNLHKRVALRVIKIVGCSPRRLHFGLIFVTMLLSMWISNAACTAMMCPIIQAVLEELQAQGLCKINREPSQYQLVGKKTREDEPPYPSKVTLCYYLGIAYASSMGGCGTIIGTATNLAFKEIYDRRFTNSTELLDFPTFMFYSVPSMLVYTGLMFLWLQWLYMGLFRPKSEEAEAVKMGNEGAKIAEKVIDRRYQELGPINAHEIQVMVLFLFMVVMYFTRKPNFFPGWGDLLGHKGFKVGNAMPTIFVVIMCFVLPANYAFLRYCCGKGPVPTAPTPSLITWKFIQTKVPWGLIFLLGGGFALAEGSQASGMAKLIGGALKSLKPLPHPALLFVVIIVAVILTAFSSNVAIANILVPVLAEMALAIEVHPLYLILPAGLACSMAFHLPVSTPPNALVAGYANVRTKDMSIAGIGPTAISIIVLYVFCQTWGLVVYPNLNTFPEWAQAYAKVNATM